MYCRSRLTPVISGTSAGTRLSSHPPVVARASYTSLSGSIRRWPTAVRLAALFSLIGVAFFALAAPAWAQSYSLTTNNQQFSQGSTGFSASGFADVPSPAVNLLAASTTTLTVGGGAPPTPTNGSGSASTWGLLTDGSYGLVPASGGGGPGELESNENGYTLTYTFSQGFNLSMIDVFSGWGDGGRYEQDYTVSYLDFGSSSFTSFTQLGAAVNPGGSGSSNGQWTQLALSGATNIGAIRFTFNAQQNNGVGYTQLAVLGTAATTAVTWTGVGGTGGNDSWDTTSATTNWVNSGSNAAASFSNAVTATFADSGANTNITIQTGGVAPASVIFTNDLTAYTFSNNGSDTNGITGSSTVTLSGTGRVTFNSPNTYTGATTVTRGTLDISNQLALQSSTLTPAGGSVVFDQSVAGMLLLSAAWPGRATCPCRIMPPLRLPWPSRWATTTPTRSIPAP